jgi:hypothetical protein
MNGGISENKNVGYIPVSNLTNSLGALHEQTSFLVSKMMLLKIGDEVKRSQEE